MHKWRQLYRLFRQNLFAGHVDHVAELAFGLLDAALEIADRIHLAQIHADGDERLRDFGRQTGDDDAGAHEPRRFDRLHQVIGHRRVNGGYTGNVDDHHFGAVLADTTQQLFGQLARALSVNDADDRQNQQTLANLEHRRGKFADRFLLLSNDAFAFLHAAHRDGVGDAVGSRLVDGQHAAEQLEIGL